MVWLPIDSSRIRALIWPRSNANPELLAEGQVAAAPSALASRPPLIFEVPGAVGDPSPPAPRRPEVVARPPLEGLTQGRHTHGKGLTLPHRALMRLNRWAMKRPAATSCTPHDSGQAPTPSTPREGRGTQPFELSRILTFIAASSLENPVS